MKILKMSALVLLANGAIVLAQCCPGPLFGLIADTAGEPIQNAHITVRCGEKVLTAESHADGKYQTGQLGYGKCDVTITAKGFHAVQKTLNSVMDGNNETNVQMWVEPINE